MWRFSRHTGCRPHTTHIPLLIHESERMEAVSWNGMTSTMTRTNQHIGKRIGSLALAVLLVTALAGAAVAPAAAQQDDEEETFLGDVFEETTGGVFETIAGVTGEAVRAYEMRFGDNPEMNATQTVERLSSTFNERASTSPTWSDYLNERVNATDSRLTYEITCTDREGNSATRYIVADRNGSDFVNERAVTPSEFAEMNRTVDYWIKADWYVCENANEEIKTVYRENVVPGEDISRTKRASLAAKYESGIETNLWNNLNEEDGT
jgi:hypothetical protein